MKKEITRISLAGPKDEDLICPKHPTYMGQRKPRVKCPACDALYLFIHDGAALVKPIPSYLKTHS